MRWVLLAAAMTVLAPAQTSAAYVRAHQAAWTQAFSALLSIPNLASDAPDIERNAAAIAALYRQAGAQVEL
ncbi:MAG: hypothetical protein ACRD1Y_02100, partial [Terriglobales bacterium]